MTDQEIIDAIDAKIDNILWQISQVRASSNSDTAWAIEARLNEYIGGLRFARELIERRTKEVAF